MKLRWSQINWTEAEEQVSRLQIRIVKATLEQKWRLVKRLQYLMTNSFYAKAIAVKRVITNKGKRTPGIDGELWKTDAEKMKAVNELNCQTYHAKPLKRIYIEKFGKTEKRPLGIPTMRDRAMQALQLLALEPVAETTADRISFGFRKYRSPEDARGDIQCLSPAKKYKLYKSSINKSLHFVQRSLSSGMRGQRVTAQLNLSIE